MLTSALTRESREAALRAMAGDELDILVVGGGVTGAGIALDAVTRGLRTGIVEMQDWAGGTSGWSSKLVHGGLRYLYNLDFALVAEGLRERGLLLTTTAPHLVTAQPFLWPLKVPVVERAYSAVGVGMYDAMAIVGHRGLAVPVQRHYSRKGALRLFPDIREDALVGAIRFFDARVDDARLVVTLIRTAQSWGAHAASRAQVVDMVREDSRVVGAVVVDLETGERHEVRARNVISATGVWTEETEALGGTDGGLRLRTSKGIHIVIPKERIAGTTGIFLRTEKSVLFIIPWDRYWLIGTTDTPWDEDRIHPVATSRDIDYLLDHANSVLRSGLTREDIIGVFAGLRPLIEPGTKDGTSSLSKVSRDHKIVDAAPGLTVISGGKLTSYRLMAEHAVDHALGRERARELPAVTHALPLVGAAGLAAITRQAPRIAEQYGWTAARLDHLLGRYGSDLRTLLAIVDKRPELGRPLDGEDAYLGAEVAMAASHEGALHLEDILSRRVRLFHERRDRGLGVLDQVATIAGRVLGWDEETRAAEVTAYTRFAEAEAAALTKATDAAASAARLAVGDVVPVVPLEAVT